MRMVGRFWVPRVWLGLALVLAAAVPARADTVFVAKRLNAEAVRLYSEGKYVEAEPLYKRALAIRETLLGP
jgi:hypothetical protein